MEEPQDRADRHGGHRSELRKGALGMLLLHMCNSQSRYAGELRDSLAASGQKVSSGSLYPALRRLEREGHLSSELVESGLGPARRYYRTTRHGQRELRALVRSWDELVATVEGILEDPSDGS